MAVMREGFVGVAAAVAAVAIAGCGSGARTSDQRLIEQAKLRAKYAVEHLHSDCESTPGRVVLRNTTRGGAEESELCVERKLALRGQLLHNPCPAGKRPLIDVTHHRYDCVSPDEQACAEAKARLKRNPNALGMLCLSNEPRERASPGEPVSAEVAAKLRRNGVQRQEVRAASCHEPSPGHWTCAVRFADGRTGTVLAVWYGRERTLGVSLVRTD